MINLPLDKKWIKGYKVGSRAFGSQRDNGNRLHAGIDLYAPPNTPIYAVDDGIVIGVSSNFYKNVGQITIKHKNYIIRYAETNRNYFKIGDKIKAGQHIADVGLIEGLEMSMLHFEMYSNINDVSPLTIVDNKPYKRRKDLVNPTKYIDEMLV